MNIDYVYKQNERYVIYEVDSTEPIMAEPGSPEYAEVEAWIEADSEREGTPHNPKVSDVVKAKRERADLLAQLDELDRKSIRPLRAKEDDKLAELEAKALSLRKKLERLQE